MWPPATARCFEASRSPGGFFSIDHITGSKPGNTCGAARIRSLCRRPPRSLRRSTRSDRPRHPRAFPKHQCVASTFRWLKPVARRGIPRALLRPPRSSTLRLRPAPAAAAHTRSHGPRPRPLRPSLLPAARSSAVTRAHATCLDRSSARAAPRPVTPYACLAMLQPRASPPPAAVVLHPPPLLPEAAARLHCSMQASASVAAFATARRPARPRTGNCRRCSAWLPPPTTSGLPCRAPRQRRRRWLPPEPGPARFWPWPPVLLCEAVHAAQPPEAGCEPPLTSGVGP
nr:putative protein FAM47C [Aegilops tauschii subsp. strangulata]